MAAQDAVSSGADTQGDLRRRNVQANGSSVPKDVADKMDEKTKQKVGRSNPHLHPIERHETQTN